MNTASPLLSLRAISKKFGSVQALDSVDLNIYPGEVHAVLGENGAGKSTLVSVIGGFVSPDSGSAEYSGHDFVFGNPVRIAAEGIRMVHQHFMLVPAFSVSENLALASIQSLRGGLNLDVAGKSAQEMATSIGWTVPLRTRTSELPVGTQQRIEILKAIAGDARILILDEPTAVLVSDEVSELFRVIERLKETGVAVVLIAHKLSEVERIADRVTVLRQGKLVASTLMRETNQQRLAEWMIGGSVPSTLTSKSFQCGDTIVSVNDLVVEGSRGERSVQGLTFDVHEGEIFGIGGVDGNGQVELAEALAGIRKPTEGTLELKGIVGYIPQDRQSEGLALELSILDNLALGAVCNSQLTKGPFIIWKRVNSLARELVEKFSIKTPNAKILAKSLSGGNQQKVVVARVLSQSPQILVAVNPTRGLDIKSASFVHRLIVETAHGGSAVILISTDTEELNQIATSITFLNRGRFVDRLVGPEP